MKKKPIRRCMDDRPLAGMLFLGSLVLYPERDSAQTMMTIDAGYTKSNYK